MMATPEDVQKRPKMFDNGRKRLKTRKNIEISANVEKSPIFFKEGLCDGYLRGRRWPPGTRSQS